MLDTLTDEQRAEEDAVDDELLQRRLDLDFELVLLGELLLGAPDGAQNTAAAGLRGYSVSAWSDRLQSIYYLLSSAQLLFLETMYRQSEGYELISGRCESECPP